MGKLKIAAVISAVLCLNLVNLYGQTAGLNASGSASQTQTASAENQNSSQNLSEEDKRFGALYGNSSESTQNSENPSVENEVSSPSTWWIFLRMIFFLAVVIAIIYGLLYFMRRHQKKRNTEDPFLRAVSSIDLAPGKSVQIVTFMNKAFLVGVSDNSVNLISEIDGNASEANKEMINAMNLYSDKKDKTNKPRSFNDILSIFMPGGRRDEKDLFESSINSTEEFVKKQHERFNSENPEDSGEK